MYSVTDSINNFFDFLLYSALMPLVKIIGYILDMFFFPINDFLPAQQIAIIALIAFIISVMLEKKFSNASCDALEKKLNEKINSIEYTSGIKNSQKKRILRKGINNSADIIYEELLINKFFNLGITYFFPMMFFLIWLDYSYMSPEKLLSQTGNTFVFQFNKGIQIGTAFFYIFCFNFNLIIYRILKYFYPKMIKIVFRSNL